MCIVHDVKLKFLQFSTTKLIILGENTFKPDLWGETEKDPLLDTSSGAGGVTF